MEMLLENLITKCRSHLVGRKDKRLGCGDPPPRFPGFLWRRSKKSGKLLSHGDVLQTLNALDAPDQATKPLDGNQRAALDAVMRMTDRHILLTGPAQSGKVFPGHPLAYLRLPAYLTAPCTFSDAYSARMASDGSAGSCIHLTVCQWRCVAATALMRMDG